MTIDHDLAADPHQDHVDAIEQLAALIADGDEARFVLVFQALANQVDGFLARPDGSAEHARALLTRTPEPLKARLGRPRHRTRGVAAEPAANIFSDPVFLQNSRKLIKSRDKIVGGVPTSDFPDCVAVGAANRWCCTGTLVAPNVVITAGHCLPRCAQRVFVGEDVDLPDEGRAITVLSRTAHPGWDSSDPTDDLSVLILAEDVEHVPPRAIAGPDALTDAFAVRLAGYGNTDPFSTGGFGRRRMVDVPLAGTNPAYGADPTSEFVAGAPALDRDSCNGDSGGPAYVQVGGEWLVTGATSRATADSVRPCGDGGIYTRVPHYLDWIRSVPGGHWA